MLRWLKRAINQNYKDLQGANKGLRRLSRTIRFLRMDLELIERKYNFISERYDALEERYQHVTNERAAQKAVGQADKGEEEGSLNAGRVEICDREIRNHNGDGGGSCQPSCVPVLQGQDTVEGAVTGSQAATV